MRYRVTPSPEVAEEISKVAKKDLAELMSRAARRMHAGDEDVHIERAVTWEGYSEEFAKWLVQEVRASFAAFSSFGRPRTTVELWARVFSRLATLLLLVLLGAMMLRDRDSIFTLIFLFPVLFLGFLYTIGFGLSLARLIARLTGRDNYKEGGEE